MEGGTAFRVAGLDLPALLRVPYLDHGRDTNGWDCVGLCRWLTHATSAARVPSWDQLYPGTRREHAAEMAGAIRSGMALFEPCRPQFGAWLLFRLFGEDCHLGWALNPQMMIHADDGADVRGRATMVRGGGTYTAEISTGPWKRRLVGAWMPKVNPTGGAS